MYSSSPTTSNTAVPKIGWLDAPWLITGITDVDDGATLLRELEAPPVLEYYIDVIVDQMDLL